MACDNLRDRCHNHIPPVAGSVTLRSTGKGAQKVSEDVPIDVNKAVADAKIAVHETESNLKKRQGR